MCFSVVCPLIDNNTRRHSGQNLLWTHEAQFDHCDDEYPYREEACLGCIFYTLITLPFAMKVSLNGMLCYLYHRRTVCRPTVSSSHSIWKKG